MEGTGDPFRIAGTTQLGVFEVERAVAEGGFGVVYRAKHRHFRAPVALKCLKVPDSLSEEKKTLFLEKFRGEAELLFRLSAKLPEVVRPLQFGVLESESFAPFLALEWLEGVTLDAFIENRANAKQAPVSLDEAMDMLAPVARALSRAHRFADASGSLVVVHRDMKPENVFLALESGETVTRVLDFGIARVRDEASVVAGSQTQGDAIQAFSPQFASPEQWSPQDYGASGPWTDVYGFAMTLAATIVGGPTVDGDLASMMAQTLLPDLRPTPKRRGARISDAIDRIFARALAVDPKERTASIEAFWNELERATGRTVTPFPRSSMKSDVLGGAPSRRSFDDEPSEPSGRMDDFPSLALPALELPVIPPKPVAPIAARPAPAAASAPASVSRPAVAARPVPIDDEVEGLGAALELDRAMPTSVASRPRPRQRPEPAWTPSTDEVTATIGERLRAPAWVLALGVAIAVASIVMSRAGEPMAIGPVRVLWIGAGITAVSFVWGLVKLID